MYWFAFYIASIALLCATMGNFWYLLFFGFPLYLTITGSWKWIYLVLKTLKRDISFVTKTILISVKMKKCNRKQMTIVDVFAEQARKHPKKVAYISADTGVKLTFEDAEQLGQKIAGFFYDAGYRRGDVVALMMENRIEFLPVCLGLSMIGLSSSLLNYNLRGDGLKHCISVCKCKAIIFSQAMIPAIKEIEDGLDEELFCYEKCICSVRNVKHLEMLLTRQECKLLPIPERMLPTDPMFFLYTSGTTGYPKAISMTAAKALLGGFAKNIFVDINPSDVFYNALPMYHGNALFTAFSSIASGSTLVIKKRFSASQYLEDCCKFNVTVINYIGEICRYLLAQPERTFDKTNHIRLASGNGLKASIWKEFKDRFCIDNIVEMYGLSEENTTCINIEGHVGAVGYKPLLFKQFSRINLIKVDEDTGKLVRGSDGLGIKAKVGEVGLVVSKIPQNSDIPSVSYVDKDAMEKATARNVFSQGDAVFMTGDLMVQDEEGYFYFHDRIGDTFRWKGENVSTNEVEGVISKAIELIDVCVYGVEVPHTEGKAGMACLSDPHRKVNVEILRKVLDNALPQYARPVFLRMSHDVHVTQTFKFLKRKLKEEGFNPNLCAKEDTLYFFNKERDEYVLLDKEVYEGILQHRFRF